MDWVGCEIFVEVKDDVGFGVDFECDVMCNDFLY